MTSTAPQEPRVGHTFGDYLIVGELGAGGMGQVYRAWHQILARECALKVPRLLEPGHRHDDPQVNRHALPLLQFAAFALWEAMRNGSEVDHALQALGGVPGALAQQAEQAFSRLSSGDRSLARDLLLSLVVVSEGVATRRTVEVDQLLSLGAPSDVQRILRTLSGARLRLLTMDTGASGRVTAKVTHEAVLAHWARLAGWIADEAEAIEVIRAAERAALEWQASAHKAGAARSGEP